MAARYVNPDNITAQGQYFYTGLPPGSYATSGAGAGNVYGAGSGGSAGVSPDYTGADAGKSWQYPASFEIKLPVWDKDHGLGDGGGTQGPPGTPNPVPNPTPTPGKRKRVPVSNAGPPAKWEDPTGGIPSAERPQLPVWKPGTEGIRIKPLELPAATLGENPAQGDRPMLELPRYSESTRATMDERNSRDRKRRASMMPAKDFAFGMEALASSEGTKGMWGETTEGPVTDCGLFGCSPVSASRSHSRPPTF